MITIDNLAHRYSVLPSEALSRATTFDLAILDASAKWERYQQDKANGVKPKAPKLTQEEMLAMVKSVKERKN
jgi:hypothetical protein